jgi:S-adenosylmethionine synthetase
LADRCEVQVAYAIGVSEPVSVLVDTEGTGKIPDSRLCELVRKVFPLTPSIDKKEKGVRTIFLLQKRREKNNLLPCLALCDRLTMD